MRIGGVEVGMKSAPYRSAIAAGLVFLSCAVVGAAAEHLVFRSADGASSEVLVRQRDDGYSIALKAPGVDSETVTDGSFAAAQWTYHDSARAADITCERSENSITIRGLLEGRKIGKTHAIDGNPWYQDWGLGLRRFILGHERTWRFWSINPADPGMVARFDATKEGTESLILDGSPVQTVRVKVALPGLLSIFFRTSFWFRASDGVLMRWEFPQGPGKPSMVTNLVRED
jgi:hypothetical protein